MFNFDSKSFDSNGRMYHIDESITWWPLFKKKWKKTPTFSIFKKKYIWVWIWKKFGGAKRFINIEVFESKKPSWQNLTDTKGLDKSNKRKMYQKGPCWTSIFDDSERDTSGSVVLWMCGDFFSDFASGIGEAKCKPCKLYALEVWFFWVIKKGWSSTFWIN